MGTVQTEIQSPQEAIAAMCARLSPVETEHIDLSQAAGRVLAERVVSDRPSPPADVSAMDGYAIRAQDAGLGGLEIAGEARIGQAPPEHRAQTATRIYTGSPIPVGADTVVKREDVDEREDSIEISPGTAAAIKPGTHIRRTGENAPAGKEIVSPGTLITPAVIGALATFGCASPLVHRPVRTSVLVTGDELADVNATDLDRHRIRDSNGPTVRATIGTPRWASVSPESRIEDSERALHDRAERALLESDAIILTGGVSMGRYDHVPNVLESLGCQKVFHKLSQRPGRPMLGAIGPTGQVVLALPGNPVSVLCTLHRLALPILAHVAGLAEYAARAMVTLESPPEKSIPMWWYRPVRLGPDGRASLISSMGSGDLASIAGSDGFVELTPGATGAGPWAFWRWGGGGGGVGEL